MPDAVLNTGAPAGVTSSIILEDAAHAARALGDAADRLEGATVLVSGGAGFLGAAMVDVLVHLNKHRFSRPARAIVVDNFVTGVPARLQALATDPNVEMISADISKDVAIGAEFQYAIHAAGIASPIIYRAKPLQTADVNVWGLRRMLELARAQRDLRGFLFFSTSEIYGDPDPAHIPTREDYRGYVSCTGPRACYDESKRFGETLAVVYHQEFGFPIRSVRPFNVYGAGQRIDDGRIIPDLMTAAVANKPLVLLSDGSATRSFCYISDATAGFYRAMLLGKPGEAYNVGNPHEVSIRQVAERMSALSGTPITFQSSADPHYLTDNPQRRCPDLTKSSEHLGYAPSISLDEGLRRTLAWAREGVR
ncbi:MAG: NAD-dependent epimerase/dehydratase family protein [Gemmatimonadetes bacterium]|nr:NAD-dependent epimerase/dehydratase family protein [Gemmatimonadota bacterium]